MSARGTRTHNRSVVVWIVARYFAYMATDNMGKPDLPRVTTRKPQSADGAVSNTPPTAFCLSPPSRTRESLQGMLRRVESRREEIPDETPRPDRQSDGA